MNEVPTSELDAETLSRIRTLWATLAGSETFPETGACVVSNVASRICPSGWAGIVAIGSGILVTVPEDSYVEPFVRTLDDLAPLGDWSAAYHRVIESRGPARLAYANRQTALRAQSHVALEYCNPDGEEVAAFVARVPSADAEEAGIEACTSPLACVRQGTDVVAAAGYRVWLDVVAHMAVLVDPRQRGTGLARTVAGAATEHALVHDLIAQWRARPPASRAVARTLGYVELGQQLSIRLA